MIQQIYFFCSLCLMDAITIRLSRKLLFDFLRNRSNKNRMHALYELQPLKSKLTLDYIYPLLKDNKKAFLRYRRLYLLLIYSAAPQYLAVFLMYFLHAEYAIFIVWMFIGIKIVIFIILRSNFDGNMVSIFRKTK